MFLKKSPAKINLFLKVKDLRADGYYNLESLMAFLDIYDEISVEKSQKFSLEITGEFAKFIDIDNNLFLTILNYFQQSFAISNNLKIKLIKNIPVGAGLGGGSSNACYFMILLNEIFNLNLTKKQLQKISFNFGCDIAFFFEDCAQIVGGKGDELFDYNNFTTLDSLIIYPQINLSTKQVFMEFSKNKNTNFQNNQFEKIPENKNFLTTNYSIPDLKNLSITQILQLPNDLEKPANSIAGVPDLKNLSITQILQLPNDLEKPAISIAGVIYEIIENVKNFNPQFVKMSGSGSTIFAIFNDLSLLENANQNLQKIYPDFYIKTVKILQSLPNQ
jgi:4-diphosphocytidyl-2C-methyl-D-erythritol kinase